MASLECEVCGKKTPNLYASEEGWLCYKCLNDSMGPDDPIDNE